MTYEYAEYFKLLLLCGYQDELEKYIDNALINQDPLSEIILALSTTENDKKKILAVLNDYLRQIDDSKIDYNNTVFNLIMLFIKRKYREEAMPIESVVELMYNISIETGEELCQPWNTMFNLAVLFDEKKSGYIEEENYFKLLNNFIDNKTLLYYEEPNDIIKPKKTLFKRILEKLFKRC